MAKNFLYVRGGVPPLFLMILRDKKIYTHYAMELLNSHVCTMISTHCYVHINKVHTVETPCVTNSSKRPTGEQTLHFPQTINSTVLVKLLYKCIGNVVHAIATTIYHKG